MAYSSSERIENDGSSVLGTGATTRELWGLAAYDNSTVVSPRGNPVTHFEVVGKDATLRQRFYAEAFGWEMKQHFPGYAMVHPGSKEGIPGGVGGATDGGSGHVTFYSQVEDVTAALQRIEELGGKTVMPSMSIPGGPTIGLFHDPEGHLIGLAVPTSAR